MARSWSINVVVLVIFLAATVDCAGTSGSKAIPKKRTFLEKLNNLMSLVDRGFRSVGSNVKTLYGNFDLIGALATDKLHSSVRRLELLEDRRELVATTPHPDVTTLQPDVTTPQPDVTTPQPDVTTQQPDVTTPQPDATTPQPDVTTTQPDVTTPQPDVTTPQPDVTTPQPDVTTPQPDVTTPQPDVTTQQPDATTPQPDITTQQPDVTTTPSATRPHPVVTTAKIAACGDRWTQNGTSLFLFCRCTQGCSFNDAMKTCREKQAELAKCDSRELENFFVLPLKPSYFLFLGGSDRVEEGTWRWPDGSLLNASYTNWGAGEPRRGTRYNCLMFYTYSLYWYAAYCGNGYQSYRSGFVCEKKHL